MKKIVFALTALAFSSCLLDPEQLSVVYAQGFSVVDHSGHDRGEFAVGHSMQTLDVLGALSERRINVHLWYPARHSDDCDNASNSGGRHEDDQGCFETPSVYTSRLYGVQLLPQWDPLSWAIGSQTSFENLPIAGEHRSFPVIVFSHGSQNNAIDYVYTLEALASFGFIVAAPDHLNNTQDDVPD